MTITYGQIYCTLQELADDLADAGNEANLYSYIQAASKHIQRAIGNFIPITEARVFGAERGLDLWVDPLLAITTITSDAVTVSDYLLFPRSKLWDNGPYVRIHQDGSWSDDDVDITGKWGLYEETEALGITGSQAAADTADIALTDGSKLAVGMVILIESEQEMITSMGSPTLATSQTSGTSTAAAVELGVDNGAEFKAGETIRIGTEDIFIQAIATNTLSVKRGWNGTTAAAHSVDTAIYRYLTFNTTRGVNGTTAAIHSSKAISRMIVPQDVNYLCRQIAGRMRAMARSHFRGALGNSPRPEMEPEDEIPALINKIKANYRIPSL